MKALRTRRSLTPRIRLNTGHVYRDTRSELKKIRWPSREETIRLTIVVIALSITMALFLGVIVDRSALFLYRQLVGL